MQAKKLNKLINEKNLELNLQTSEETSDNKRLRKITLQLKNYDVDIVNALRRIILAEIPNVSFIDKTISNKNKNSKIFPELLDTNKCIKINTNTSVLNNEFLSHRLSLIPITSRYFYDDISHNKELIIISDIVDGNRIYKLKENLNIPEFELNVNKFNKKLLNIFSNEIKINKDGKKIDSGDFITKDLYYNKNWGKDMGYCLLNTLRVRNNISEQMNLKCFPVTGNGHHHSCFSLVGTVEYMFEKLDYSDKFKLAASKKDLDFINLVKNLVKLSPTEIKLDNVFLKKTHHKYKDEKIPKQAGGPQQVGGDAPVFYNSVFSGAIDLDPDTYKELNNKILIDFNNFERLDSERCYKKNKNQKCNSILLSIESISNMNPFQIFVNAIYILKIKLKDLQKTKLFQKLHSVKKLIYDKKIKIEKANNLLKNSFNILIKNESHTLGNLLSQEINRCENIKFSSYKIPHPLEDKLVINLLLKNDEDVPLNILNKCINKLLDKLDTLLLIITKKIQTKDDNFKLIERYIKIEHDVVIASFEDLSDI